MYRNEIDRDRTGVEGENPVIALPLDLRRLARSDSPYYRASFFVCLGAVAMALSGLLDLADRIDLLPDPGLLHGYLPYSVWTFALVLFAIGFLWIGTAQGYSKAAIWVALLHVGQALNILVIVITQGRSPFAPVSLTVGRLLTVLVFVLIDRARLPGKLRLLLAGGLVLQIAKIFARAAHALPAGDPVAMAALDTGLVLWLAAALLWTGSSFLEAEKEWEEQQPPGEAMGLADFNNPEHPWNKPSRDQKPV